MSHKTLWRMPNPLDLISVQANITKTIADEFLHWKEQSSRVQSETTIGALEKQAFQFCRLVFRATNTAWEVTQQNWPKTSLRFSARPELMVMTDRYKIFSRLASLLPEKAATTTARRVRSPSSVTFVEKRFFGLHPLPWRSLQFDI